VAVAIVQDGEDGKDEEKIVAGFSVRNSGQ